MEPEGSLPCSQAPATGLYPEPDASSPHLPAVSLTFILLTEHEQFKYKPDSFSPVQKFSRKITFLIGREGIIKLL
jgi:hypothetical protein